MSTESAVARPETTGRANSATKPGTIVAATPDMPPDAEDLDWLLAHPARLHTYLAGRRHGRVLGEGIGYSAGYADAIEDMLGPAVEIARRRPSRVIPHDELERRRGEYRTEPLSAAEIRASASASWGLVEDEIRMGGAA